MSYCALEMEPFKPQTVILRLLRPPRGKWILVRTMTGQGVLGSDSRKLTKSDDQRMDAEFQRITEELATDKRWVENLDKTYPQTLFAAYQGAEMIQSVRQKTLAQLDGIGEKNQARLDRLTELFTDASVHRHGESINRKLLASVVACQKDCNEFAAVLETKKQQVRELRPAQVTRSELGATPNHWTGQTRGIAVH